MSEDEKCLIRVSMRRDHIPSPLPTSQSLQIPSLSLSLSLSPLPYAKPNPFSYNLFLPLPLSLSGQTGLQHSKLLLPSLYLDTLRSFSRSSVHHHPIDKMAQRTEKEETEFKVPETLTLCVNNCGVTGNPATNNMCQKCFSATTATSSSSSNGASLPSPSGVAIVGGASILKFSDGQSSRSTRSRSQESRSDFTTGAAATNGRSNVSNRTGNDSADKKVVNRCSGCRKRVGLIGFRCRCGELFCAEHRYSDRHDCSYDYKEAGREAIARENPVVKAAKIIRV